MTSYFQDDVCTTLAAAMSVGCPVAHRARVMLQFLINSTIVLFMDISNQ